VLSTSELPPDTSEPVLDTTIAGVLLDAAAAVPDETALIIGGADPEHRPRWTFAELRDEAQRAAAALADRFSVGERVAVYAPTTAESMVLTYAAALAGLILVPINAALRASELRHILASSAAAGVFCVETYRDAEVMSVVSSVRPSLPALREVVTFSAWEAFCSSATGEIGGRAPDPDDVALIVFTSGTTGAPKGARLTHRAMTNSARLGALRFGIRAGDVYVDTMPLAHVGGQYVAIQIMQRRATNVLVPAFEPGLVLELIETYHGTLTVGVPTMLVAMIDHPDFRRRDLSSLRSVSSGGAVVPADLVRHIEAALGVQVTIVFGQTETCGLISQTEPADAAEDKAETLGRPIPQLAVRVVDPATGGVVGVGEVGELQVRGFNVMAGYHDLAAETAEAILPDGWLRTGDLVTMDGRGYLRIAGRLKEMVVSGGLNLFPVEIERVIATHPAVAQVAVVGLPDRRWGEMAVAVVCPQPGAEPDPAELEAHARAGLAAYKVPKRWVFVDELPVTPFGKVQKFLVRQRLLAESTGTAGEAPPSG